MVIVPMPFESNAGLPPWSAEERRSMRNRLFVLTNKLQETAKRRRRSPASAPPCSGPITGIPWGRADGPETRAERHSRRIGFWQGKQGTGARPPSESPRRVKSVQMLVGFKTLFRIGCIGESFDRHRA
jgi:hypothetical protein